MKILIFMMLVGFAVIPSYSQDSETEDKNHFISLSASGFSGIGLSYKYSGIEDITLKGTFIGYASSEEEERLDTEMSWYNFGFEVQYDLNDNKSERFYLLTGLRFQADRTEDLFNPPSPNSSPQLTIEENRSINIGLGLGIEFHLGNNFYVNLDGGFVYLIEDFTDISQNTTTNDDRVGYTYTAGIGVSYNF